ncbi:hypothetical protein AMTR_s00063p00089280 [Amborella trichopoda]|uniref:Malectin-like domain-containing protein n=1 Tax=Amborella trichopoda TaxID=13333 RepID=U5CSK9_AMBTC|nr:hypothetical protein AMTR_s00063p00089280 [Amborella trichopoda]
MPIDDSTQLMQYRYLRMFKHGQRNCYNVTGLMDNRRYLIRAWFLHANYDSSFKLPKFDLYLGVDFWYTVSFKSFYDPVWTEIISLNPGTSGVGVGVVVANCLERLKSKQIM